MNKETINLPGCTQHFDAEYFVMLLGAFTPRQLSLATQVSPQYGTRGRRSAIFPRAIVPLIGEIADSKPPHIEPAPSAVLRYNAGVNANVATCVGEMVRVKDPTYPSSYWIPLARITKDFGSFVRVADVSAKDQPEVREDIAVRHIVPVLLTT